MAQKQSRAANSHRRPISAAMHYSVMIALIISNITSLGLAFLMAQLLGVSMGNIAIESQAQRIQKANAQVYSTLQQQSKKSLATQPVPLPTPAPICDDRWVICSQVCDDSYDQGNLTKVGWRGCESDCDLRVVACEKSGTWQETAQLRDTTFQL